MATLRGSIEANVPVDYADLEWREFIWRSMGGARSSGFPEAATRVSDTEFKAGTVTFQTDGKQLTKVLVELEYTPRASGAAAEAEIAQAQERFAADLERYRAFLLRRCEQESCRTELAA